MPSTSTCNALGLYLLDIDAELALMLAAEADHGEAEAAPLRLVELDARDLAARRHRLQGPLEGGRFCPRPLSCMQGPH
jgi:hypothetical protein